MKVLVMLVPDFNDYEIFANGMRELIPEATELCYYGERSQHFEMCERFSLEEFEMPCKVFYNEVPNKIDPTQVKQKTVDTATKYIDAVIWFSALISMNATQTVARASQLNKKVFHYKLDTMPP